MFIKHCKQKESWGQEVSSLPSSCCCWEKSTNRRWHHLLSEAHIHVSSWLLDVAQRSSHNLEVGGSTPYPVRTCSRMCWGQAQCGLDALTEEFLSTQKGRWSFTTEPLNHQKIKMMKLYWCLVLKLLSSIRKIWGSWSSSPSASSQLQFPCCHSLPSQSNVTFL